MHPPSVFTSITSQTEKPMAENKYQAKLIKTLERRFPGCVVLKNDPQYQQGILDLTILIEDMWAMLEVKDSPTSAVQPNQEYFVNQFNNMSFAAIIHPQNEVEVLNALQQAFEVSRRACIP